MHLVLIRRLEARKLRPHLGVHARHCLDVLAARALLHIARSRLDLRDRAELIAHLARLGRGSLFLHLGSFGEPARFLFGVGDPTAHDIQTAPVHLFKQQHAGTRLLGGDLVAHRCLRSGRGRRLGHNGLDALEPRLRQRHTPLTDALERPELLGCDLLKAARRLVVLRLRPRRLRMHPRDEVTQNRAQRLVVPLLPLTTGHTLVVVAKLEFNQGPVHHGRGRKRLRAQPLLADAPAGLRMCKLLPHHGCRHARPDRGRDARALHRLSMQEDLIVGRLVQPRLAQAERG